MNDLSLDNIIVTPLKRITTEGGDVMHAMKNTDNGFNGFGEVYFSWVKESAIKSWKCHQQLTLNLVVPLGEVRLVFHLPENKNEFRIESIGINRYSRLTVPPGIWFGFQGVANGSSLLMNVTDFEHNPDEVLRKNPSDFTFEWSLR